MDAEEATTQRLAAMAIEVRAGAKVSIGSMAIMVGVLLFVRWRFGALVEPAWLLDAWLIWMWGAVAYWAAAMVLFYLRRPDDEETVTRWTRPGAQVQTVCNIGIAACPWVLLSNADLPLQYITTLLYVWYVAMMVMASNVAVPLPGGEVALLTISNAAFAIWKGGPYSGALAAFIVLIGLTMIGFRRQIRQSALTAAQAQVASEQSERIAQAALARATAERDGKTRFIAAASHDLQQPLFAADLFLTRALALAPGAERDAAIAGVRAAFGSTQALLGSMLDHLRLEHGAVQARLTAIDLGKAIDLIATEYGPAAHAAAIKIRRVRSGLWAVADPDLLHRALGNLVTNAIRHSRGEHVLLAARRRGERAELWVIDDGRGIDPKDAATLFDDFAQGSRTDSPGFGIGLASVRRQMGLMAGDVDHVRRWRSGAAFRVRLPLVTSVPG